MKRFLLPLLSAVMLLMSSCEGLLGDFLGGLNSLVFDEEMDLNPEVPAQGATLRYYFVAPLDWSAKSSEDWVQFDTEDFTADAEAELCIVILPNESEESRTATVTITSGTMSGKINIVQKAASQLVLTTSEVSLPRAGGEFNVQLKSNVEFDYEIKADWISAVETRSLQEYTLRFKAEENPLQEERVGEILFKSGNIVEAVTVTQSSLTPIITLSTTEVEMDATGGEFAVQVEYNVEYKVAIDSDWVTEVATRATQTNIHNFNVAANESADARTAKITISAEGISEVITVTQKAASQLIMTTTEVSLPQAGGEFNVQLKSNVEFDYEIKADWISAVETRSLQEYTLRFKAEENPLQEERVGEILFKSGSIVEKVTVTQSSLVGVITLSTTEVEMDATGGEFAVQVEYNVEYKVAIDSDWVTEVATRATQTNIHNFNVAANESADARTAKITISAEGISEVITVTQKGKEASTQDEWELVVGPNGEKTGKFRGAAAIDGLYNINTSVEVDVEIYEHKTNKGIYMLKDPWSTALALSFGYSSVEAAVADGFVTNHPDFIINCSNPNCCYYDMQETVGASYGPIYTISLYPSYNDDATLGGTLKDGVLTFPAKALLVYMPGYNSENLYYANISEHFRLLMPGAVDRDYSLTVEYQGVDNSGTTPVANVAFHYGADVTGIKYVVANGNIESDYSAALSTLLAGESSAIMEVENFVKGAGSAGVQLPLSVGTYTVVAAPKDKDGALSAGDATAVSFFFMGNNNPEDYACVFEGTAGKFSEYMPDLSSEYPDHTSIGFYLKGERIVSVSYYLNTSETVATWTDTPEALVAAYGSALSPEKVAAINTEAGLTNGWVGLSENTEYTAIVVAKNEFGESKTIILVAKTEAAPNSGELKIGTYTMADSTTGSSSQFELLRNGDSSTDFFVKNLGINNNAQWYAKYDSAAGTLTLDGTELGYEDYGNQFGSIYGYFNKENNWVYGLLSFATEDSGNNSPLVFTVDATNKTLSALQNFAFQIVVLDYGTMEAIGAYGSYLGASTVITYGAASTSAVKSAATKVLIPYSSIKEVKISKRMIERNNFKVGNRFQMAANSTMAPQSLRYVEVKAVRRYEMPKPSLTIKRDTKAIKALK